MTFRTRPRRWWSNFSPAGKDGPGLRTSVESFAIDNLRVVLENDSVDETALVAAGAVWRYLDDGSNQGTAWKEVGFNHSSWLSGPAELGYGDGDEATLVGFGPDQGNKFITTYFRHAFNVADPSQFAELRLELLRDDGAAVYLNGTEIARDNLQPGRLLTRSPAARFRPRTKRGFSASWSIRACSSPDSNVLAVEVHQADPGSSDVSFNARLIGIGDNMFGVLGNDIDV